MSLKIFKKDKTVFIKKVEVGLVGMSTPQLSYTA
tara:strand:- start:14 stop:115 length:102 start_codon:yes stop_codon:yes gene_type:complete